MTARMADSPGMAIESLELFTTSMALLSENGWRLCGGEVMLVNSKADSEFEETFGSKVVDI